MYFVNIKVNLKYVIRVFFSAEIYLINECCAILSKVTPAEEHCLQCLQSTYERECSCDAMDATALPYALTHIGVLSCYELF